MKNALIASSLLVMSMPPVARAADPREITEAELLHRTQVLYDAVEPGNQTPWKLYFADDALIFDEKGRAMDKDALLKDLQPLPHGYSGLIRVVRPKSVSAKDVFILSYDCEETETIFGQQLHARYHTTDTWLYRNRLWQISASQTLRYYEDPSTGAVAESLLNDYLGVYELAPGNRLSITRRGSELYAQRSSGEPYRLLPESPDLFFRAGVEGRRLFRRNSEGRVDTLIDRRNNEDIVWKKMQ